MSRYVSAPTLGVSIVTGEHGTTVSERMSTPLALADTAPGLARRILNTALAEWGLGHLVDSAELITSELVTNALVHGEEPALLTFYTDRQADSGGLLFVEVEDAGSHVPHMRAADDGDEHGRGLILVEAISEDWGSEPVGYGKRVWASLAIGTA